MTGSECGVLVQRLNQLLDHPLAHRPCPLLSRPRTATVASRQHGCLHPTVSTMQSGANQACRALVAKRACKWCAMGEGEGVRGCLGELTGWLCRL